MKFLYIVKRDDFFGNTFYMFREVNFISNVKPRCFWNKLLLNGILLNKRVGWSNFFIFLQNITSCACSCLLKSGLKIIFHWKAQLVIACSSWLEVVALTWMLFTTEKRNFASAKNLQFEERSFGINHLCK